MNTAYTRSELPGMTPRRGKVRDVYDFGDRLLVVATDRISAFDWVLPTGIPDKGRVLTQLSAVWFGLLPVEHHLLSLDPRDVPLPHGTDVAPLEGRSMVAMLAAISRGDPLPVEQAAPHLAPAVAGLVMRLIAHDMHGRPADAQAVAAEIAALERGLPPG